MRPPQRHAGVVAADAPRGGCRPRGASRRVDRRAPSSRDDGDPPLAQRVERQRRDVAARRQLHRRCRRSSSRASASVMISNRFMLVVVPLRAMSRRRCRGTLISADTIASPHRASWRREIDADVSARRRRPHGLRAEGRLHLPRRPGARHVAAGHARLHRRVELRHGHDQLRRGAAASRTSTTRSTASDVIIVEDIVDTGLTLSYLQDILRARGPRSRCAPPAC